MFLNFLRMLHIKPSDGNSTLNFPRLLYNYFSLHQYTYTCVMSNETRSCPKGLCVSATTRVDINVDVLFLATILFVRFFNKGFANKALF